MTLFYLSFSDKIDLIISHHTKYYNGTSKVLEESLRYYVLIAVHAFYSPRMPTPAVADPEAG